MWGGQSCPQPPFRRLDRLEKRVRGQNWPHHIGTSRVLQFLMDERSMSTQAAGSAAAAEKAEKELKEMDGRCPEPVLIDEACMASKPCKTNRTNQTRRNVLAQSHNQRP